jgi:GNAT superfamily N-acetyltransferase
MARIVRLLEAADRAGAINAAEAVFWESASTKNFTDEAARSGYRELWFSRYLRHAAGQFLLAVAAEGEVIGYLAGALISDKPPLSGPDYYPLFPPELIQRFPAHLHVNVRADRRGTGIGAALVQAFIEHCHAENSPGLHAVTRAGSRSAAFFRKCGLAPDGEAVWRGRRLSFLAADAAGCR